MSGISSVGSSSLPNGGLSSVGASLLTSGVAPSPTPAAPAASSTATSPYEAQYQNLIQYDNQELLYASFLSPSDALANADAVFAQAAQLLGTPGQPNTSTGDSTSSTSSTDPASSSSTSTASSALTNVPSIESILSASDAAAQQTLGAYANAPAGSSILDYQA